MSRAKKFKDDRIELRIPRRIKERLKRAADYREQHMSEFILLAVKAELLRAERAGQTAAPAETIWKGDLV